MLAPLIHKPSRRPLAPRKKVSYTKAVTLCIALKCNGPNERVVCCFDTQIENEYESSESEYKLRTITPTVVAMYSGPSELAKDLIDAYIKALGKTKLKTSNYRDALWKPMKSFTDANAKKEYLQPDSDVSLLTISFVEGLFRISTVTDRNIFCLRG
jgi:hypothetical protein